MTLFVVGFAAGLVSGALALGGFLAWHLLAYKRLRNEQRAPRQTPEGS